MVLRLSCLIKLIVNQPAVTTSSLSPQCQGLDCPPPSWLLIPAITRTAFGTQVCWWQLSLWCRPDHLTFALGCRWLLMQIYLFSLSLSFSLSLPPLSSKIYSLDVKICCVWLFIFFLPCLALEPYFTAVSRSATILLRSLQLGLMVPLLEKKHLPGNTEENLFPLKIHPEFLEH